MRTGENLYNQSAEEAVLGAMFVNNNQIDSVTSHVGEKDFYKLIHRQLFHAIVALHNAGKKADPITMDAYLSRYSQMQNIGMNSLIHMADHMPMAHSTIEYADIVHTCALRRKLTSIANRTSKVTSDPHGKKVGEIINSTEDQLIKLSTEQQNQGIAPMVPAVKQTILHSRDLALNQNGISGLPTGYPDIDHLTTGMHNGELIVVAARPAMGKTTFGLNVAQKVASNSKLHKSVCIFSLEMNAESLIDRMICAREGIDASHLRAGQLTASEHARLNQGAIKLANEHIFIDETAGESIGTIVARAHKISQLTGNLGLIIVDYLQLVTGSKWHDNRQQEVAEVSQQLKNLAKTLNVPVLALCQLSRSVEQRENKRPLLSDLRESGAIEQDADIVAFLYRQDYYDQKNNRSANHQDGDSAFQAESDFSDTEFIIKKNRSGANGTIHLVFDKPHNRFLSEYHKRD